MTGAPRRAKLRPPKANGARDPLAARRLKPLYIRTDPLRQGANSSGLEVFGSAARGVDFDHAGSDADFLVTFMPAARNDLAAFADFKDALESLLGRPVDLVEREAVEASRNFIRRRRILSEAEAVYG
jgi:predicted nucleotidyltransferase